MRTTAGPLGRFVTLVASRVVTGRCSSLESLLLPVGMAAQSSRGLTWTLRPVPAWRYAVRLGLASRRFAASWPVNSRRVRASCWWTASPSEMGGSSVRVGGSGLNDRSGRMGRSGQIGRFKDGRSRQTSSACPVQLVSQHPEEAFDPALSLRASLAEAGDVDGPRAGHLMRIFSWRGSG